MSRLVQMQEKQKKLTRFQTLKSIFTSLFMTTAIVVVVAVILPKSPIATIDKIESYTNEIVYTINITDEDGAIIPGTLKLQLVNQSEEYERSITVGLSSGLFQELSPDTPYTLKVMADKGFGLEVLASEKIKTAPKTGGAITGFTLNSGEEEYLLEYLVNYFISDPFDEYQTVQMRYATKYPSEEEFMNYQTIALSKVDNESFISSIYNSNLDVQLILEAIDINDQVVELDQIVFHTPYQIYGSVGIEMLSKESVSLYVWTEPIPDLDVEYEVVLMQGGFIVDRQDVIMPDYDDEEFHHMEQPLIVFDDLFPETSYHVLLYATYHDPYTLVLTEKEVQRIDVLTTPDFDYTISIEEMGEYYFITIVIDDPKDFYDYGYYYSYTLDGESWLWNQSFQSPFQVFDDEKQVILEVFIPIDVTYKIEIGISDDTQFYHRILLETLTNRQEG